MLKKRPLPQLEKFYLQAKALADAGEIIDSNFLCHTFGVTKFGASCLLYMLNEGQYYPCLEKIYTQDDDPNLIKKHETKNHFIEFTENFPSFDEGNIFGDDMSKKQKALYVSMGVARYMSSEELRQSRVGLYLKMDFAVNEYRAQFLAALDREDAAYVKEYFGNMTVDAVRERLKKRDYTKKQIEDAVNLFSESRDSGKV